VVFLLLAALAAGMAHTLAGRRGFTRDASCEQEIARVNLVVEKWFFDTGRWPADDLSDIGADPRYFPDGPPRCPITGQRYRLDPRTHRVRRCEH